MLAVLVGSLCASHVQIARFADTTTLQDVVVAKATVRGVVDQEDNLVVLFGGVGAASLLASKHCAASADVAMYTSKLGYVMQCYSNGETSTAVFQDFSPRVTLTKDAIEFIEPEDLGARHRVSTCDMATRDIYQCIFTGTAGGMPLRFRVSPTNLHHLVTAEYAGQITTVRGADGSFAIDTVKYNAHRPHTDVSTNLTVAIKHTDLFLHHDGERYSLWQQDESGTLGDLFGMSIMLFGAIVFIPNSVYITALLRIGNVGDAVSIVGGLETTPRPSRMHTLMIDFSSTAAAMTAWLTYSNGVGKGTFRTRAAMTTSVYLDLMLVSSSVVAAIATAWCVARCRFSAENPNMFTSPNMRGRVETFFQSAHLTPPTVGHVALARIGFEYTVVVAFMAACPIMMGEGFMQCIYVLSTVALLNAVGRDTKLIVAAQLQLQKGSKWALGALLMMIYAVTPLIAYSIMPVVEQSHSFATTPATTLAVSVATAVTVLCVGAHEPSKNAAPLTDGGCTPQVSKSTANR